MKQETKQPLYKVLNNCRTNGNWGHRSYLNGHEEIITDAFVYEAGKTIFEVNYENKDYEANAQYAALAVNNLHHLAEALEMVIEDLEIMKGGGLFIAGSIVDINMTAAKEALSRIS